MLFARGGREEGNLIFLSFPLQLRRESLFIYSPLGFDAIILFLFMRGRVFLVVAPRVFYLGGFSVSVEGVRFFSFSLANEEEIRILVALLLSGINVCKRAGRETRKLLGGSPGFLPGGLFRIEGKESDFFVFLLQIERRSIS